MSANFTGVTFAKQKVTPSYDGIVRRAMLTDGTLTGCEMSYSGSTLTMAAGQLMICGRQIVHPSSQNWAVTEQTSGYARLVITVDLTRTSTKETFDQVVDSIQYATSVDGFASLEQTDINTTGTKYQVAACVVSLGTGGITGIVSKLEKCEGGGAGLNFKVVGGTTTPGSPTENTIWVNTDVAIPSWAFSVTEPGSPAAGMVWISTGTKSTAEFNALKKNDIHVYPGWAKQYIGSEWVLKEAEIYQGGQWVTFVKKTLLSDGSYDGTWAGYAYKANGSTVNTTKPNVSISDGVLTATYNAVNSTGLAANSEMIDFSHCTTLTAELYGDDVNDDCVWVIDNLKNGFTILGSVFISTPNAWNSVTIDVSEINQTGYVAVRTYVANGSNQIQVRNITLR